jgi:dTDP-4-dehydrorhamnose reductase
MTKILILGAKGMLGQELVRLFRKDSDYKILAWDKEDLDITSETAVYRKIKAVFPAIIVNAAAYNAVDKCEENKKEFTLAKKINSLAPGYLAKTAKKIGAVLIHYSTDYVFDGNPEIPEPTGCAHNCGRCGLHKDFVLQIGFAEDARANPISNYGQSKLMGEKDIAKNAKKYYLIRTSKLFGKSAQVEGAKKSFFEMMLELGKKNKKIKAVDEEVSCFTYAPDLAKKTKEILESKKPFGIYHIVNSEPCTWYEATLELYHQAKVKTQVIPVSSTEFPRPAKRPAFSVLLNTKLNPLRDWKEALKEYLRQMKNVNLI